MTIPVANLTERWLPVVRYEGVYEVSDQGRMRSVDRMVPYKDGRKSRFQPGQNLRVSPGPTGYPQATLNHNGAFEVVLVHRLVLRAFIGPCPSGCECLHANDIKTDNRLTNLSWNTPSANKFDLVRNGKHWAANKTHCPRGHEYSPENTYVRDGRRWCRQCRREKYAESRSA
jgi:hypothetical protein